MSSFDQLSAAIRALRKDCSMTQVEFAAALNVAPASIHRWESGTSVADFEMIISLWSFAIEHGSRASTYFAEFLTSRTDAIRPLFEAAQAPALEALDRQVGSLAVDQRHLVLAFIRMLKQNSDPTADRVMRLLLEPWTERPPAVPHPKPRLSRRKSARDTGSNVRAK